MCTQKHPHGWVLAPQELSDSSLKRTQLPRGCLPPGDAPGPGSPLSLPSSATKVEQGSGGVTPTLRTCLLVPWEPRKEGQRSGKTRRHFLDQLCAVIYNHGGASINQGLSPSRAANKGSETISGRPSLSCRRETRPATFRDQRFCPAPRRPCSCPCRVCRQPGDGLRRSTERLRAQSWHLLGGGPARCLINGTSVPLGACSAGPGFLSVLSTKAVSCPRAVQAPKPPPEVRPICTNENLALKR